MDIPVMNNQTISEDNEKELFRMLDRGIDDMEAGRELPLDEAFDVITKLKKSRRNERA